MKIAKAIVMLTTLVLAYICFAAPAVIAGDEHPWDEESPSSFGQMIIDPNGDGDDVGSSTDGFTTGNNRDDSSSLLIEAIITLQKTVIYYPSVVEDDNPENEVESPDVNMNE